MKPDLVFGNPRGFTERDREKQRSDDASKNENVGNGFHLQSLLMY